MNEIQQEVFVRSDRAIARLGLDLAPDAQEWLRDALLTIARS